MSVTLSRALVLAAILAVPSAGTATQDAAPASPTTRLIAYTAALPARGADGAAAARTVTFALYDEPRGGALLWSETQTIDVDARGRFSTYLGSVAPLPLETFRTERARWLEVRSDGQVLPRTMLVAVPYALRAADAETLGGTLASEFVRTDANGRRIRADGTAIDDPLVDGSGVSNQLAKWADGDTLGSSVVTESFDNRVGVFAPDPTGGGVVDARFTVRHLDGNTAIGVLNTLNQRRFALNTASDGRWTLYDGANGVWNAGLSQVRGRVTLGPVIVALGKLSVAGVDSTETAIFGTSPAGTGVQGSSPDGTAVFGGSVNGNAIRGQTTNGAAISGHSFGSGLAGEFTGNVTISGTLTKGGGAFEIDHPLDPANKYLRHSFVESPDMMNVYNGNVTLDAKGEAWVTLPEWFEALNRDFRYQLTAVGAPGPNLYIATKVSGNRFKIAGGAPDAEVSWQITGIRQDAWANTHRIQVEENKKGDDAGRYLHPDAYGLGSEMAVPSARPNAGVVVRKEIR